jgi:hypothetical protein
LKLTQKKLLLVPPLDTIMYISKAGLNNPYLKAQVNNNLGF